MIENLPSEIQVGINLTCDGNLEDIRTMSSVKVGANSSVPVRLLDTTTSIENEITLPTEYAIQQNYPNPFNKVHGYWVSTGGKEYPHYITSNIFLIF